MITQDEINFKELFLENVIGTEDVNQASLGNI
jgi:hypothetical protein